MQQEFDSGSQQYVRMWVLIERFRPSSTISRRVTGKSELIFRMRRRLFTGGMEATGHEDESTLAKENAQQQSPSCACPISNMQKPQS